MTLILLPSTYPDELLYSVFARFHILSQNISLKETANDLFGRRTASAVVDLPNNLQSVFNQLPLGTLNTPANWIEHHTLFPLFRPFLSPSRASKVVHAMKYGGDVHTTIGVMASGIQSPRWLRFCSDCVKDDTKQYGEPYWHRCHQVFGFELCPLHQKTLLNSSVSTGSKENKHAFIAIDETISGQKSVILKPEFLPFLNEIAKSIQWLLNNYAPTLGLEEIRERYLSRLRQMALSTVHNHVRQKQFVSAFQDFYGNDFLTFMSSSVNNDNNWLLNVVRKPRFVLHPIRHLLLIHFFGLTPEQFFSQDKKFHPFGSQPWLCLNPSADHYKKPVIHHCKVTRDYESGIPVGTFECTCGFIYSRRGPDADESDRFKIGRIKQFGHVWEEKLIHLIEEKKLSNYAAARELQCDPTTVKKQLNKLRNRHLSEEPPKEEQNNEIERLKHRSNWLNVFHANPSLSKTEIRQQCTADYAWLYRHDREWLHKNSPTLLPRKKYADNRVNWAERDEELFHKAAEIIKQELSCENKPIRITTSFIGKQLGQLALIQKHLEKMPKLKALIEQQTESIDDFQIRRVKHVAEKLRNIQLIVMKWQIVREAGLRPGYSKRVAEQIEREISSA